VYRFDANIRLSVTRTIRVEASEFIAERRVKLAACNHSQAGRPLEFRFQILA